MTWILDNSLWLAALGLMLFSSGFDGEYLSKLQPRNLAPLGYALNTMLDIVALVLPYWRLRLSMDRSTVKQDRAKRLGRAEWCGLFWNWLFTWLQLRPIFYTIEVTPPLDTATFVEIVAALAAGFVPVMLKFIGTAQGIRAGREEAASTAATTAKSAATAAKSAPVAAQNGGSDAAGAPVTRQVAPVMLRKRDFDAWLASFNGNGASVDRADVLDWAQSRGADVTTTTGRRQRDKVLRWLRNKK